MEKSIKNLVDYLDNNFPKKDIENWDRNGLIIGSIKKPLNSVLLALDLTNDVIETAVTKNVSIIITHHPFLFELSIQDEFKKYPYKKNILNTLIDTGIAYYALHTTYDISKHGMRKAITNTLDLESKSINNIGKYGVIIETAKVINLHELINKLKKNFKVDSIGYGNKDLHIPIYKVGFLPGSGDIVDIIQMDKKEKPSVIITSDVKWSDWITASEMNIKLLEISHSVENVFVESMVKQLEENFSDLVIYKVIIPKISQKL